jgi:hypothetical protein
MSPFALGVVALALSTSCTVPGTVESLQANSPPPEFGRPAWVRTSAGVGAWVGGIFGGVISIALLPVTYPVSLIAGDGLGDSRQEFLFLPAVGGAAVGHFLLGTPPDLVDHLFRRAWQQNPPPENTYELVPMVEPGSVMEENPAPAQPAKPSTGAETTEKHADAPK